MARLLMRARIKGPSQPLAQIRRGLLIYGTASEPSLDQPAHGFRTVPRPASAIKKLFTVSIITLRFYQYSRHPITSPVTRASVAQIQCFRHMKYYEMYQKLPSAKSNKYVPVDTQNNFSRKKPSKLLNYWSNCR